MEFLRQPTRVLRSARPYVPADQSGDVECMMVDLILGDIQAEITRIEEDNRRKRRELLDQTKTPDYSWLMDWRLKSKKLLGYRESAEVEYLCARVKPNEWNRLIRDWRTRVKFVESREQILPLFRTIVDEICAGRYQRGVSVQNINEVFSPAEVAKRATMRPWTSQGSTDHPHFVGSDTTTASNTHGSIKSIMKSPSPAPTEELSVFSLSHHELHVKFFDAQDVV